MLDVSRFYIIYKFYIYNHFYYIYNKNPYTYNIRTTFIIITYIYYSQINNYTYTIKQS